MILASSPCRPYQLQPLLAGELSSQENHRLEEHLSHCISCQKALEQLAGNQGWWESTEIALRTRRDEANQSIADRAHEHVKLDQPSESLDHSWLEQVAPGGRLGPFQLEKTIGFGGTGVVALAFDTQLNRRVAVKVLYPHLAASGAARQRFTREAHAAAAVVHPSVVPIHAVNAEHSPPYIVMSYVPGGSLQQRLDQHGPLDLIEVLRIGLQVAEGLSSAHDQGLVHRDVKPANILLESGTDRVLLTDFGLARALDDASLTASGFIAGTPPYMSPEQARGESIDGRSDLFSVGSLLFVMATGRLPFHGNSPLMILQSVNENATPSVTSINERMPLWVDRLIGLCHAKSPSDRMETSRAFADVLRRCLAHVHQPSHFPLPKEIAHQEKSRRTTILLSLMAILGILLGIWLSPLRATREGQSQRPQSSTIQSAPNPSSLGPYSPKSVNTPFSNNSALAPAMIGSQSWNSNQGQTNILPSSNFHRSASLESVGDWSNDSESQVLQDMEQIKQRLSLLQLQIEKDWK